MPPVTVAAVCCSGVAASAGGRREDDGRGSCHGHVGFGSHLLRVAHCIASFRPQHECRGRARSDRWPDASAMGDPRLPQEERARVAHAASKRAQLLESRPPAAADQHRASAELEWPVRQCDKRHVPTVALYSCKISRPRHPQLLPVASRFFADIHVQATCQVATYFPITELDACSRKFAVFPCNEDVLGADNNSSV